MTKKGIDVSEHQGKINWNNVKTDFAIIRAGYGREISQKDKQFDSNYKGCKDNNIPCGAYWYSYAMSADEAIREAQICLEVLKEKKFEYPIFFDIEERRQLALGKAVCTEIAKAFLEVVENAGYWVGIYSSKSHLENYLSEDIRKHYAVWVAQYSSKCTYSGQYGMWQYGVAGNPNWDTANVGSVSGVSGQCDCNYCYIDYPTEIKKAGLNGFKPNKTGVTSSGTISNTPPKKQENYTYYTVKKGDCLWDIAQKKLKNGSRYTEIKKLNGLKSDTIHPGDKLKIPKY